MNQIHENPPTDPTDLLSQDLKVVTDIYTIPDICITKDSPITRFWYPCIFTSIWSWLVKFHSVSAFWQYLRKWNNLFHKYLSKVYNFLHIRSLKKDSTRSSKISRFPINIHIFEKPHYISFNMISFIGALTQLTRIYFVLSIIIICGVCQKWIYIIYEERNWLDK